MTQTALDEFARRVRYLWHWLEGRGYEKTVESVVREEIANHPNLFGRACNEPEYIAYCKEQDRKAAFNSEPGLHSPQAVVKECLQRLEYDTLRPVERTIKPARPGWLLGRLQTWQEDH